MRHPSIAGKTWGSDLPLGYRVSPDTWWRLQSEQHQGIAAERRTRAGICMANAAATAPHSRRLTGWIVRFWCDAGRRALRAAVHHDTAARDLELMYGQPRPPAALTPPPDFV